MPLTIPAVLDADHRRCLCGNEPMIFHCHHYNAYLQRTIRDADYVDSVPFLVGAASEVAHAQLTRLFKEGGINDTGQRKVFAQELYRWAAFGTFDLSSLSDKGGLTQTKNSHYAMAWRVKYGQSKEPVCYFASGWLAGAVAAIYDLPNGSFSVTHRECSAAGAAACAFELKREKANYAVFKPVGAGALSQHKVRPIPPNNVDYDGILKAVSGMPLVGNEEGLLPAFGVYLTHHYANYYNRISFELLHAMEKIAGASGQTAAEPLLIGAGHVCAFFTLGGIMVSPEWDALIKPSLKTREDWVHGIIAVINCLGWGRWQVTKVSEAEAEFVIHDDYESVGYQAMYGKSKGNVSFLATGGVSGIMHLVYVGNIASKPKLDQAFYEKLFMQKFAYKADCVSSKAKGDEVTAFRVSRV